MPLRDVKGQPSRLLNIRTGEVVCPDKQVQYAAVSYVWGQWEEQLDKMLHRLSSVMEPTRLEFVWIDQKCIDQTSGADKETEIKKMRAYYEEAAITFVMVPEWSTTFTWELAGFVMNKEQVTKAVAEVEALKDTEWMSRVWTVQEALLSRRVVFVGTIDAKSAVELAIARTLYEVSQTAHENVHAHGILGRMASTE